MRYRFYTADVFTDRTFGGNPLAVLPNAQGLSAAQMQRIAREFNLSESTFVLPPTDAKHTRRVRIFSPRTELPFAGHPTVGTAYVLARIGDVALTGERTEVVFEEGVGPVRVSIMATNGEAAGAQLSVAQLPEFRDDLPAPAELAAVLSLDESDLLGGDYAPQAVSCGVPFTYMVVHDREALGRAQLDMQQWRRTLADHWAPQLYCFTFDPEHECSDVRARAFAPAVGIEEDPATGAAASALAGYLATRDATANGTLRWVVEQGFEMGRPSILEVEADKQAGAITAVRVSGGAVLVSEGWIDVPDNASTDSTCFSCV